MKIAPECYAICEKENNIAIGAVELKLKGYTDMTQRDDECELGYWLGQPFGGKGYMPEAARESLRHRFEDLFCFLRCKILHARNSTSGYSPEIQACHTAIRT